MVGDTVSIRLNTGRIRRILSERPELSGRDIDEVMDRMLASFHRHLEAEADAFTEGNGNFEVCLFEAL